MLPGTRSTAALAALLLTGAALAQGGLRVAGNQSLYGARSLRPGFVTAPVVMRLGAERLTDVAPRRLGPACVGLVTVEPNYIVRTTARLPLLRFHVRSPGDTALVVNTPDGRWRCDDNGGGGHNPLVDAVDAEPGQYDIWVGRRAAGAPLRATLTVTERADSRP